MPNPSKAKSWIFRIIQPSDGYLPSRIFDLVIMALIAISVLSVFAATFSPPKGVVSALMVIEIISCVVFSIEYVLRVWTADLLHPDLPRWRARLRYVCSGMALVDLVAILPFWLPVFFPGHLLGLRAVRLIRLLRIFKLNRYMEAMAVIGDVFRKKSRELVASGIFVLVIMLLSSLLMYHAEHGAQPNVFRNAFSGLWWAVATLTTVGYGDIYPVTTVGRLLGAVIALSGIAALAVPTGIITAGLTERLDREVKVDHELARQRKVDEAHDDELARRRERDAEHDRLLREQAELLQSISEKLEQVERRVSAPKS